MIRCRQHPKYRARRKPTPTCVKCCEMYVARKDQEYAQRESNKQLAALEAKLTALQEAATKLNAQISSGTESYWIALYAFVKAARDLL